MIGPTRTMDKRIGFIFKIIYFLMLLLSWFVAYQIYKIGGRYPGELPPNSTEEMKKYAYHPLLNLVNLATVWGYCGGATIGACIGMMDFMLRKPFRINILVMSFMLNVTWGMLYVLEWANVIE